MRTQILPECASGAPWLEHFPAKGGLPEKTLLDKSPFLIGRDESADLQVASHGVSREHAAVVREGRVTRIRDLGSTNGTFVNGQRVTEADLHDGDMVQVADVEFAFYCGASQPRQAAVTQVLAPEADADRGDSADDLRRAVRHLHETLLSGCLQSRLKPIVALQNGQVAGYQTADDDVPPPGFESYLLPPILGRVAARLRHLRRMRGVEQAATMPGEFLVFAHIRAAEVSCGRLLELAGMFCDLLPEPRRLVIAVPLAAAKETAQTLAPGGRLRKLGVAVALSDCGGRDVGPALLAEIRPDFVRVAASIIRGVPGGAMDSCTIQAMVRAIGESGAKVIAAGISTPAERAACLEAGYELGEGALFEERREADAPLLRPNLNGPLAALNAFYLSQTMDSIKCSCNNISSRPKPGSVENQVIR